VISRASAAEQVAAHLIAEIGKSRWAGRLPGVNRLAADLGVSRETVRAALLIVEQSGHLKSTGAGKPRVIVRDRPAPPAARRGLRVALLLRERLDQEVNSAFLNLILRLRHALEKAGHICISPPKSQDELGLSPPRIIRMVEQTEADAWVIATGSLELLEWFCRQPLPALAIGGRLRDLPIAGASTDHLETTRALFRRLIAMGHRRITWITERERRIPCLGKVERTLKDELEAKGIPFGEFNMPDWEETPEGLEKLLHKLFRLTPPTAIHTSEWATCVGVLSFLHRRGLRVPEDVSVITETTEVATLWHRPLIAHYLCDYSDLERRIMRWVAAVARGEKDLKQSYFQAGFEAGGSIAPPKSSR
jgi:DNA-binding LacI/PurR family transcriptional regulator